MLAALMAAVFGPVDFVDSGQGPVFRRTSPQGGARQEIDAYVGVLDVSGPIPAGTTTTRCSTAWNCSPKG